MNSEIVRNIVIFIVVYAAMKFFMGSRVDKDADLKALLAKGAILVDVRTPGEYAGSHPKAAVNVPLNMLSSGMQKYAKDKSKTLIVFCHSGSRSGAAKKMLQKMGYENVVNAGSLHRVQLILGNK